MKFQHLRELHVHDTWPMEVDGEKLRFGNYEFGLVCGLRFETIREEKCYDYTKENKPEQGDNFYEEQHLCAPPKPRSNVSHVSDHDMASLELELHDVVNELEMEAPNAMKKHWKCFATYVLDF
ncbi:hypothetical protein Pint_31598 [Pistacia integerrima]|uniref:Uncharacterized protein n=1 Tax=Pistacia integerrima TaxID=434235 RepID=A0ACC0XND0_9ROSI|nr:hypothetical protein Pint_31598 [Pistacia integerrima]